jgi:hypothetical protein
MLYESIALPTELARQITGATLSCEEHSLPGILAFRPKLSPNVSGHINNTLGVGHNAWKAVINRVAQNLYRLETSGGY